LVIREQAEIPQCGILALTLDDRLLLIIPPLRSRLGVVVAGKESEGAHLGEGPLPRDVIHLVNKLFVDSVAPYFRSSLDLEPSTATPKEPQTTTMLINAGS
jgi:hypothetical protein